MSGGFVLRQKLSKFKAELEYLKLLIYGKSFIAFSQVKTFKQK